MQLVYTDHPDRLPPSRLKEIDLLQSSARHRQNGVTAAEALAWMAGEPHSETPRSVCPVILALIRLWSRNLSQEGRNILVRPILPLLLNTGSDTKASMHRADTLMHWTVLTNTTAWLDAGAYHEQATLIRSTRPQDLFKLHKGLEQVTSTTSPKPPQPEPLASRALQASGHFMPERYRTLQQKARTAALNGAVAARRRRTNVTPLVHQLQVNLVQTILAMPGISEPRSTSTTPPTNIPE